MQRLTPSTYSLRSTDAGNKGLEGAIRSRRRVSIWRWVQWTGVGAWLLVAGWAGSGWGQDRVDMGGPGVAALPGITRAGEQPMGNGELVFRLQMAALVGLTALGLAGVVMSLRAKEARRWRLQQVGLEQEDTRKPVLHNDAPLMPPPIQLRRNLGGGGLSSVPAEGRIGGGAIPTLAEPTGLSGCAGDSWGEMFEATPGLLMLVGEDARVVRMNGTLRAFLGEDTGEEGGRTLGEVFGCGGIQGSRVVCGREAECETCPATQLLTAIMSNQRPPGPMDLRRTLSRQGVRTEVILSLSASRLRLGGRDYALFGLEDVTGSRWTEERLREQLTVVASAHDAICLLEPDGGIRHWNQGAERLYGWTLEEVRDRSVAEVLWGGMESVWERVMAGLREEGHWDGELHPRHRAGRVLTIEARVTPLRERGRIRSLLLVASDLTDRRELEKQLQHAQRLETVGTLTCGVAHDLNNVLAPVQMVADMLPGSRGGAEVERFTELLRRSTRRGADLIRQLLEFGRGSGGGRTLVDMGLLVKETTKMLRETFPRSIHLRMETGSIEAWVMGDATQLHQVLLNLCINARDAMPEGGQLALTVSQRVRTPTDGGGVEGLMAGPYVVVEVADTGSGIAADIRDRVFEPFFSTKPPGKGTGLGLSIARNLVREHQGAIEMESKPEEGTRFRLWLPQSTAEVTPVVAPRAATERVPLGRRCVLVVDDEDALRELMILALEQAGYRVLSASDGAEGVSVFGRHQDEVEAVVVDMVMPYLDGAAAIEVMRRIKPGVPVVAISGLPEKAEEAVKAAPSRAVFLQKPFSVRHLTDELGRILEEEDGS